MKNLILIPGNPPVKRYYNSWAKEFELKNKKIKVHNFETNLNISQELNTEDFFNEIYENYLKQFEKISSNNKIIIIGHSVGSIFVLKLLEKFPEKIEKVILLFPYLEETQKSRRYLRKYYFLSKFKILSKTIIKYKSKFEKIENDFRFLSKSQLDFCRKFASKEYKYYMNRKFDSKIINKYKEKIEIFYTRNDMWCSEVTINKLKPIVKVNEVCVPHHFIIDKKNRCELGEKILEKIN